MTVQSKSAALAHNPAAELSELYDHDYYSWTAAQAQALRERRTSALDWRNMAEEVEDLGRAERHRLESHLEALLMHLLKWSYQPQRRTRSWRNSIEEHRFRVQKVLRDNPSLKSKLPDILADSYLGARFGASKETGLKLATYQEN